MKVKYRFSTPIIVGSGLFIMIALGGIIFYICKLAQLFGMKSFGLPLDIVGVTLCSAMCVFAIILLTCAHYRVDEKDFVTNLIFVKNPIPYGAIDLIRFDKIKKVMILYYTVDEEKSLIKWIPIHVNVDCFDSLAAAIKEKNTSIIIEDFIKE